MKLFSKPTKEIFADFEADESKLSDIRDFIETVLKETPFPRKDITALLLAVEEACTNVIRHAYLYGEGNIKLRINLHSDRMEILILDNGRTFDFEKSSEPDLKRYIKTGRKGGLGVYLIRKITDKVSYDTRDGVNQLKMTKRYPRVKTPSVTTAKGISLRWKFSLWTSLVMLAIIFFAYLYWDNSSALTLQKQFTATIEETSGTIASQSANFFINEASDVEFDEFVRNFAFQDDDIEFINVLNKEGMILASTQSTQLLHTKYKYPANVSVNLIDQLQISVAGDGSNHHFIIRNIAHNKREFGSLNISYTDRVLKANISSSRRSILKVIGIALLFSIGAVYLLSNYFVKPISRIIEGVRKIGKGDLDSRIKIEGAGEFGAIAQAFNEMTVKFKQAQNNIVEQERMRKEMQVAQDIQHALLPREFPDIEGFDIAAIYRAAKDVGGDYYDFVWIDPHTLGIVVADVSGKGVPGSLVMTMIRTAIRLESRGNRSAVDILSRVNDFVTEDVRKGMFITLFLVVVDSKNRKISFASAGHNPMVLYRRDTDKTYFLNPKGIPVGITLPEGVSFEENLASESVRLKKEDLLVIYTDGITEAMNQKREQYGDKRFLDFIRDNADLTPEEFNDKFSDELKKFCGDAEQNDDITMVVIKEKIEADQYIYARRRKLLDLVSEENKTVAEACRLMGFSPSTYYRYRKRFELHGDEGLLNKNLRVDDSPTQLTFTERNIVLDIIMRFPEYGATRIRRELQEAGNENDVPDDRAIYNELVRLRLNTKRQRFDFVQRQGGELSEEQKVEFQRLSNALKEPSVGVVDRKEYLQNIKDSIKEEDKQVQSEWHQKFALAGFSADKSDILMAMFAELDGQVNGEVVASLFENVKKRLKKLDVEAEEMNVVSTARLEEIDIREFEKSAESGVDLEIISLPEDDSNFNFEEYEQKLTAAKKNKEE